MLTHHSLRLPVSPPHSLLPSHPPALHSTARAASGGGPNYFPGLIRQTKPSPASSTTSPAHHSAHLAPAPGGRRHSLTEADALAARPWAFPRTSMTDPAGRAPLAPGVYVVEGGPAVATPGFQPARTSIADPDWVAAVPGHRAP